MPPSAPCMYVYVCMYIIYIYIIHKYLYIYIYMCVEIEIEIEIEMWAARSCGKVSSGSQTQGKIAGSCLRLLRSACKQ